MKKFLLLMAGLLAAGAVVTAANNSMETAALTTEQLQWFTNAGAALHEELAEDTVMATIYMTESYEFYSQAGQQGELLLLLPSGSSGYIQDVMVMEDASKQAGFNVWYQLSVYRDGQEYTGYADRAHLAVSDEDFLEWEQEYGTNPATYEVNAAAQNEIDYSDVAQFPESYQPYLRALKEKYPNWIFVKQNTLLDWEYVIEQELQAQRSLIQTSRGGHTYDNVHSPGWGYASREVLKYYMDPRNGLTEEKIFQFEQLTYNASYHTEEALKAFLDNTFMGNGALMPGTELTYSYGIWAIGAEEKQNVSPFHLAARIYQEQGQGTSPLISGTYPGFEGYYNFFNVKASGTTNEEIYVNGLTYAKQQGWNNGYYAILGGAEVLVKNYISKGQDTLYLQKYNVIGSHYALFTHQYMQNIAAPSSEGVSTHKLYKGSDSLQNSFVFKIPVYENMPQSACAMPTAATRVAVEIPEGYGEAVLYADGAAYKAEKRNGQFIAEIGKEDAKTAVLYSYDEGGMPAGMKVWLLEYVKDAKGAYYKAEYVPEFDDILYYDGFSIRITGNSGIRMISGILSDTRSKLLKQEISGYELTEYGVIVLPEALLSKYPLVKDSDMVGKGIAYGKDATGKVVESVVRVEDGRHYFAAVLVGLPVEDYKTEYSFKSYVALNRNGQELVIYGPQRTSNIYAIANFMLQLSMYPEGSSEKAFLEKLINDSDALVAE